MTTWRQKILKIGSKTHSVPKQYWDVDKLNKFGNLTGQSSHVQCVFNYVRAFWFCPVQKKISCVWSQSRHMVTYIVCAFECVLSLLRSDSQQDSFHSHVFAQPPTFRHVYIETTVNMGEHIARRSTFITITKLVYLPDSHILDFALMTKSLHIWQTHMPLFGT